MITRVAGYVLHTGTELRPFPGPLIAAQYNGLFRAEEIFSYFILVSNLH